MRAARNFLWFALGFCAIFVYGMSTAHALNDGSYTWHRFPNGTISQQPYSPDGSYRFPTSHNVTATPAGPRIESTRQFSVPTTPKIETPLTEKITVPRAYAKVFFRTGVRILPYATLASTAYDLIEIMAEDDIVYDSGAGTFMKGHEEPKPPPGQVGPEYGSSNANNYSPPGPFATLGEAQAARLADVSSDLQRPCSGSFVQVDATRWTFNANQCTPAYSSVATVTANCPAGSFERIEGMNLFCDVPADCPDGSIDIGGGVCKVYNPATDPEIEAAFDAASDAQQAQAIEPLVNHPEVPMNLPPTSPMVLTPVNNTTIVVAAPATTKTSVQTNPDTSTQTTTETTVQEATLTGTGEETASTVAEGTLTATVTETTTTQTTNSATGDTTTTTTTTTRPAAPILSEEAVTNTDTDTTTDPVTDDDEPDPEAEQGAFTGPLSEARTFSESIQHVMDAWAASPLVESLDALDGIIPDDGECPTAEFDALGASFVVDAHCPIIDQYYAFIRGVCLLAWGFFAIFRFMSA